MRAVVALREDPHYRREAFAAGLGAAGYAVECIDQRSGSIGHLGRGDVLLVWNRAARNDDLANVAAKRGAAILVAENGYIGRDANGHQLYALARDQHLGAGAWWPERLDGRGRWKALGLALQPWRREGGHVLLCESRGIGAPNLKQPRNWPEETLRKLRRLTDREVRRRPHPGKLGVHGTPPVPFEADLAGAWCVVTWGSAAGIKAIVAGVPVIYAQPKWIGAGAATSELHLVECPPTPPRRSTLERVAAAQWSLEEISRGDPFRHLLQWQS